ncbi:MAG: chaperone NapD [Nitrospirota bacterium]
MIVASGFIEVNEERDVETVVKALEEREVEVTDRKDEKIVFLIEREATGQVKETLDSLKNIEGVRSVYLAYFSLEGADRDPEDTSFFEAR